jgi:hypothetical protein
MQNSHSSDKNQPITRQRFIRPFYIQKASSIDDSMSHQASTRHQIQAFPNVSEVAMKRALWRWLRMKRTSSTTILQQAYLRRIREDNLRFYESLNRQCDDLKTLAWVLNQQLSHQHND